ncbi:hypothetical protein Prudu_009062 [Prunus dulcis]|uniref:Uncharacterized protein n=1 Tax=Prunus dulcis TaxID=3755 RepID=A0A4Y1R5E7_PRUDU|nr:hypothetical protein Prudu_009062 [Prunus dulcis]
MGKRPGGGFPVHVYRLGAQNIQKCLGDTKSTRAANWQDSGDRSQPDPHSWLSRSGRPRNS